MQNTYTLLNGDCLEKMKQIEDNSVDLILCDLPYGITNCEWDTVIDFKELWEQYNRIAKERTPIVLFSAQPFTTQLIHSNLKDYRYTWYWIKNITTGFAYARYQPMRKMEEINVFYKKAPIYKPQGLIKIDNPRKRRGRRPPRNGDSVYRLASDGEVCPEYTNYPNHILEFKKEAKTVHPTQKPIDLLEYLIKTYSNEGDIVLDNCMGSGSTGVACMNTNRSFIGIELTEYYYNIASDRIKNAYIENIKED